MFFFFRILPQKRGTIWDTNRTQKQDNRRNSQNETSAVCQNGKSLGCDRSGNRKAGTDRADGSRYRLTYNYSRYYYEATDGEIRFAHEDVSAYYADETQGPAETEYDIRGLYGSTSAEPIPILMDVIVMAMNCLMGKDIVWSGGLKKRRVQCSSFLIVVR